MRFFFLEIKTGNHKKGIIDGLSLGETYLWLLSLEMKIGNKLGEGKEELTSVLLLSFISLVVRHLLGLSWR